MKGVDGMPHKGLFSRKEKEGLGQKNSCNHEKSLFSVYIENPENYFKQKSSTLELDFACVDSLYGLEWE